MTDDEARPLLLPADVVALTMYGEARGEPIEGRIAVGCVLRNRLHSPNRYGATLPDICWRRAQFSCWNMNDPNSPVLWRLARSIASQIHITDPVLRECRFLADGIVSTDIRDTTGGATHYYAPHGMKPAGSVPSWATGVTPVARIGNQLFFRGV